MSGYVGCALSSVQKPVATGAESRKSTPPDDPVITEFLDLDLHPNRIPTPITYTREFWMAHLKRTIIAVGEPDTPRCKRHGRQRLEHIGPHTLDGEHRIRIRHMGDSC